MDIEYISGSEFDFVSFIKEQGVGEKAQLIVIEGKYRWRVTRDDGTFYIARPESAK